MTEIRRRVPREKRTRTDPPGDLYVLVPKCVIGFVVDGDPPGPGALPPPPPPEPEPEPERPAPCGSVCGVVAGIVGVVVGDAPGPGIFDPKTVVGETPIVGNEVDVVLGTIVVGAFVVEVRGGRRSSGRVVGGANTST